MHGGSVSQVQVPVIGAVMVRRWTTADADGTAAAEEWDLVELVPDGRCGVCGLLKTAGRGRGQGCEMRWAGVTFRLQVIA